MMDTADVAEVTMTETASLWFVECSIHGPLGLCDDHNVERVARAHMEDH